MDRIVMHIDVNNAFLSWTAVYLLNHGAKYDIRNSYAVIGGDESSRRGIVLAKSMPAKKLGIVTGETLYSARKKCPALKTYPMHYSYYQEMSSKMFDIIKKYTPDIEVASIDECYLEYTNIKHLYGDELEFAKKLQSEIYDTLGFTVNIGIANNKLTAKMASDFTKPNKIHTLYDDEVEEKMYPLPIGELFGIGKKTSEKLIKLDINTIGDLANADINKLKPYFKNMTLGMINSAKGINSDPVVSETVICKGIGNEITLKKDALTKQDLYPHLLYLSEVVGIRIRKQERYAYTVVVVLKDKYFKRKSHQKKLLNPIDNSNEIFEVAKQILSEMEFDPVRLVGIRLDNLVTNYSYQLSLFEKEKEKQNTDALDKTVDSLKEKYGYSIIDKARLKENKDEYRNHKRN